MFVRLKIGFIVIVLCSLVSCSSDSESSVEDKHLVTISQSFNKSKGDFTPLVLIGALHTAPQHDEHQVNIQTLPSPYENRQGLHFKWPYSYPFGIDETSGALGASLSTQVVGLTPLTSYSVSFEMNILSNVPDICSDSYGAIGNGIKFYSSVYLQEPTVDIFYALMTDFSEYIGEVEILSPSPSHDTDRILMGDLSLPISCGSYDPNDNWESKVLTGEKTGIYKTDENGQGWLYFAINSSYEVIFNDHTEFYIMDLEVTFQEL